MRVHEEHEIITNATIAPSAEQRTSGVVSPPVHPAHPVQPGPPSLAAQIGHFVGHFVQMCLACCIGGITLSVLVFGGAALLGAPNLVQRLPEVSTLVIAVNLALPMAAWMRFRGMAWRPTGEMAGTPLVTAVLLISLSWFGIVPGGTLVAWLTSLACPVMLIPMLFRLDLYTGRTGHHHGAHAA
jgi:hypothetical protein